MMSQDNHTQKLDNCEYMESSLPGNATGWPSILNTLTLSFVEALKKEQGKDKIENNFAVALVKKEGKQFIFVATSGTTLTKRREKFKKLIKDTSNQADDFEYIKLCDDIRDRELEELPIMRTCPDGHHLYQIDFEKILQWENETKNPVEVELIKDMFSYIEKRKNCTERKIIYEIMKAFKFDEETTDLEVFLFTQLPPCLECSNLIKEFRKKLVGLSKILVFDFSQLLHIKKVSSESQMPSRLEWLYNQKEYLKSLEKELVKIDDDVQKRLSFLREAESELEEQIKTEKN
jgi:hypothetical protein